MVKHPNPNPDGTLGTPFNPNANGPVVSIAVQADGKIVAGGRFNSIGGQMRNCIARFDANTDLFMIGAAERDELVKLRQEALHSMAAQRHDKPAI